MRWLIAAVFAVLAVAVLSLVSPATAATQTQVEETVFTSDTGKPTYDFRLVIPVNDQGLSVQTDWDHLNNNLDLGFRLPVADLGHRITLSQRVQVMLKDGGWNGYKSQTFINGHDAYALTVLKAPEGARGTYCEEVGWKGHPQGDVSFDLVAVAAGQFGNDRDMSLRLGPQLNLQLGKNARMQFCYGLQLLEGTDGGWIRLTTNW